MPCAQGLAQLPARQIGRRSERFASILRNPGRKDFHEKSLFFLASLGATAVKTGPAGKNFPRGIRIVIDVENQL
jgi:hypothetical protein